MIAIPEKFKLLLNQENSSSVESLERLLSNMSTTEAINESVKQLTELRENQSLDFELQLKQLFTIDEVGHRKIQDSIDKRLNLKSTNRARVAAIDAVVCPYYNYLFFEYLRLTDTFISNQGIIKKPEDKALFFCRAIHAGLNCIKWQHFDDQPAPPNAWKTINKLFKVCEILNISLVRVFMYAKGDWITDATTLVTSGAMFSMLHKESFSAAEIHRTAEYLLKHAPSLQLSKSYDASQYQYYLDICQDGAAQRLRGVEPKGICRYWTIANVVQEMERALDAIVNKSLSADDKVRALGSAPVIAKLFKKLCKEWSVQVYKRQRRATDRVKVDKYIEVSLGFDAVYQALSEHLKQHGLKHEPRKTTLKDISLLDYSLKSLDEAFDDLGANKAKQAVWRVVDESEQGFGIDLGFGPDDELDVGYLLGFQDPNNQEDYLIAEIKSLKKQKNSAFRAGLQVVTHYGMDVSLFKPDEEKEAVPVSEMDLLMSKHENSAVVKGIWIPALGAQKMSSSVVVPYHEFKKNRQFKMQIKNEQKTLILGAVIAFHDDWVRATVASIK